MFAFNLFNTACCSTVEHEDVHLVQVNTQSACCATVEHKDVQPVQVITQSEHVLPSLPRKAVTFKDHVADIEECSTMASEGSPDSETSSNLSDETTSTSRKTTKPKLQPLVLWEDVIDRCRVPTWDNAITNAWEDALKAGSFASAWDDAVKAESRPAPIAKHEIRKPPELLMVQSLVEDRAYNGVYALCLNQTANGMALWKHVKAEYWVYSCTKGKWCIGGQDVALDGFQRASGFLYQNTPHRGALPDAVKSGWHFWDKAESCFREDSTIFVQTMY